MPRKKSAERKARWEFKQRVAGAQKMRDKSHKEEMERLSKPPVTPEWVERINERNRNVIGGDRALRGRPRLTPQDRGVNKRVHNQRDKEGRTFRTTETEREYRHYAGDSRWGRPDFTPAGESVHGRPRSGSSIPERLTDEQRETWIGQNRYKAHADRMRERDGIQEPTHGSRHRHNASCYSDTCKSSPNPPVTDPGKGRKAPEAPVTGRWIRP